MPEPTVDAPVVVRRAAERFHTQLPWLDSRHSFSFGGHYDPDEVGHGLLIVSNDDRVAPGGGFSPHPHRDMEIVTWVLEGALEHRDSAGHEGVITPGLAQRMSAGTGIVHSEMNHSPDEAVHFVQMWVVPDRRGVEPGYEQRDLTDALGRGGLVAVASGRGDPGAVSLHQHGAALWAARLRPGDEVRVPDAPYAHVFVARGGVDLEGTRLEEGDAARLRAAGPLRVVATEPAEILVWESDTSAGG